MAGAPIMLINRERTLHPIPTQTTPCDPGRTQKPPARQATPCCVAFLVLWHVDNAMQFGALILLHAPGTGGHELGQRLVNLRERVGPLSSFHALHEDVEGLDDARTAKYATVDNTSSRVKLHTEWSISNLPSTAM